MFSNSENWQSELRRIFVVPRSEDKTARPHHCRQAWACEPEGAEADIARRGCHHPALNIPPRTLDHARQRREHSWSMGAENELLEMQGENGGWLHPRFSIGPGVLGCRPAPVLLEEVPWLQEQRAHNDISLHEMRSVGIVRGEALVAASALRWSRHPMRSRRPFELSVLPPDIFNCYHRHQGSSASSGGARTHLNDARLGRAAGLSTVGQSEAVRAKNETHRGSRCSDAAVMERKRE